MKQEVVSDSSFLAAQALKAFSPIVPLIPRTGNESVDFTGGGPPPLYGGAKMGRATVHEYGTRGIGIKPEPARAL